MLCINIMYTNNTYMKSLPTFSCTKDNDVTERLKDINYADAYAMQIKICCAKLHNWLCVFLHRKTILFM